MPRGNVSDQSTPLKVAFASYGSGWSDYDATYPCGVRKTAEGLCVVEGLIKTSGALTAGANVALCVLPVGFRPLPSPAGPAYRYFATTGYSTSSSYFKAQLLVQATTGQVNLTDAPAIAAGGYVGVDPIIFIGG